MEIGGKEVHYINLPVWAICYLLYGEGDEDFRPDDYRQIDYFLARVENLIMPEGEPDKDFCPFPAFGGPCDCEKWGVIYK